MNNTKNKKNAGKIFLVGGILGGVVGLTSGLLFAPKSGKDLRNNIRTKTAQLCDNSAEIVSTACNSVVPVVNKISEQPHTIKEKVMEYVSNIKNNNHL